MKTQIGQIGILIILVIVLVLSLLVVDGIADGNNSLVGNSTDVLVGNELKSNQTENPCIGSYNRTPFM